MKRHFFWTILTFVSILLCTFLAEGTNTYSIYFASDRKGNLDIYSCFYPSRGEPKNLTSANPCVDTEPCVSGDGKKLIYTAYSRDGRAQIFIMNVDGSDKKQLTSSSGTNKMPSFSGDGKKIVFISTRDKNEEVYTMNSDGSNQKRLTFDKPVKEQPLSYDSPMPPTVEVTRDRDPSFFPDGKKILWTSYRDGNADLFVMNVDGSKQVHLTNTTVHYHNIQAIVSPDGNNIIWASDRDGDYDLFTMKSDGTGIRHLTKGGFGSHCPHFSRDRKKIVFCSDLQGPNWQIFIMDSGGKNIEKAFSSSSDDWTPSIY